MKVNSRATIELASLKERRKKEEEEGEKSIFDSVQFGVKTAVLEGTAMFSSSISHVENDSEAQKT